MLNKCNQCSREFQAFNSEIMKNFQSLMSFFCISLLALVMTACAQFQFNYAFSAYKSSNFMLAIDLWRPMAEQGNSLAQFYLAEMYVYSPLIPHDYDQAAYLLNKSARLGNKLAMTRLASMYANGYGVKKNPQKAMDNILQTRDNDEPYTLYNIGILYQFLEPNEQNLALAQTYYQQAAEKGFVLAQIRLGNLYEQKSTDEDLSTALEWYEQVLKNANRIPRKDGEFIIFFDQIQGFFSASYHVLGIYDQQVSDMVQQTYLKLAIYYLEGKPVQLKSGDIVATFDLLAKQGDLRAQSVLGTLYKTGLKIKKDEEKAKIYFSLAAKAGDINAQYEVAELYDVPSQLQQHDQALFWYGSAAAGGSIKAQSKLGEKYAAGLGVPKDLIKAFHWYNKAAQQKNSPLVEAAKEKLEKLSDILTPAQLFQTGHSIVPAAPGQK